MSKLIVKKGSPMVIKGDNTKFIDELFDQLRIVKIRAIGDSLIVNPRYGLGE